MMRKYKCPKCGGTRFVKTFYGKLIQEWLVDENDNSVEMLCMYNDGDDWDEYPGCTCDACGYEADSDGFRLIEEIRTLDADGKPVTVFQWADGTHKTSADFEKDGENHE